MRIAIVNDLALAVEALRRVLAAQPSHELAWVARDGAEAVARCAADTPDLILMDLLMPVMDGVEATRRIMTATPCAILVVTSTVEGNASKVFDALGAGALDAVNTPVLGGSGAAEGAAALLAKIATIGKLIARPAIQEQQAAPVTRAAIRRRSLPFLVLIGASTGGPAALARVLGALPRDLSAALIVVQHVDQAFAPALADWLHSQGGIAVRVATGGCRPEPGVALLAATNDHLVLTPELTLEYTADPRSNPFRPSVDVLFHSAAACWRQPGTAVVLTGMGKDGAAGMLALHRSGWLTIAQDRETSLIYGMPKACAEAGAVVQVLPLARIAGAIAQEVEMAQPGGGRPA